LIRVRISSSLRASSIPSASARSFRSRFSSEVMLSSANATALASTNAISPRTGSSRSSRATDSNREVAPSSVARFSAASSMARKCGDRMRSSSSRSAPRMTSRSACATVPSAAIMRYITSASGPYSASKNAP
jgi:hypothetical protein